MGKYYNQTSYLIREGNKPNFSENIIKKLGVALHINKVIEGKYIEVLWSNAKYIEMIGKSLEERNRDIRLYHNKHYTKRDNNDLQGIINASEKSVNSLALLYKHKSKNDNWHWIFTMGKPQIKNQNNVLTQFLAVSIDITLNKPYYDKVEKIQSDILSLRNRITLESLSTKEKELLRILVKGQSEKEIAEQSFRSIHTIRTHLKNIRKKLGYRKNTELVKFALETGIA